MMRKKKLLRQGGEGDQDIDVDDSLTSVGGVLKSSKRITSGSQSSGSNHMVNNGAGAGDIEAMRRVIQRVDELTDRSYGESVILVDTEETAEQAREEEAAGDHMLRKVRILLTFQARDVFDWSPRCSQMCMATHTS